MRKRVLLYSLILSSLGGTISSPIFAEAVEQTDHYVKFTPTTINTPSTQEEAIKINLPFDAEIYDLAYQTFLANKNVNAAFILAQKAVNQKPNNFLWRTRLQQVAVWNNQPAVALKQMIYLLHTKKSGLKLSYVLDYSNYAGEFKTTLEVGDEYIKDYYSDSKVVLLMSFAYQGLAEPLAAIDFLRKAINHFPSKKYYQTIIDIYSSLYDNEGIRKTAYEEIAHYGLTPKLAITLSEAYYLNNRLEEAERPLIMAIPLAKPKDKDFWNVLAQLAWLLNDNAHALLAYQQLAKSNSLDQGSIGQYILLSIDKNPDVALEQAFALWDKYKDVSGLIVVANYLAGKNNLNLMLEYFSNLTPAMEDALKSQLSFWTVKIKFYQDIGDEALAKRTIFEAIQLNPGDGRYQLLYLSFLLNQLYLGNETYEDSALPNTLLTWMNETTKNPDWLNTYSFSYSILNQPLNALKVDLYQLQNSKNDPDFMSRFASDLDTYGYHDIAEKVSLYALQHFDYSQISAQNISLYNAYLGLASRFMPINTYYAALRWLASQPGETNKEPLLNFAQGNNLLALSKAISARYPNHSIPAWAVLKQAMLSNDIAVMYHSLNTVGEVLPKDDRVTAANQLRDIPLAGLASAQTTRIETYERNKNSAQMSAMMSDAVDKIKFIQEYDIWGEVEGPLTKIKGKFHVGEHTFQPYVSEWFTRSNNATLLVNVPHEDLSVGLIWDYVNQRNQYEVNASIRRDLATFPTLLLSDTYQINHKLSAQLQLGLMQLATQTMNLWVAGAQNIADLTINYQFSNYDSMSLGWLESQFVSQEGTYVGNGGQWTLNLNHKLWLTYPDYTVGVFAEADKYNPTGSVSPFMAQVLPANQPPVPSAFIPQSFWQGGANFSFGQNLEAMNVQEFRPYMSLSLFYNTVSGKGDAFEAGIWGSVFGQDNLSLYIGQSMNSGGVAQNNYLIGLNYQYFL